ncbi:MAG TPA: hypothetical protein VMD09_12790 [Solirubrobacteraceae bacterium]|nr:hypothetical protein [Solirubrobacteraceae bacterium]
MSRRRSTGAVPRIDSALLPDRHRPPARRRPPTLDDLARRIGVNNQRAHDYAEDARGDVAPWVARAVEQWRQEGGRL